MSTGFAVAARRAGLARAARASPSDSGSTRSPAASQASAHSDARAAGVGEIATRSPRGSGWRASRAATSNISPTVSARITPACANSASTVTSEAASSAPVCDAAARAPGRRAAALDRHDRLVPR